ncbi:hypothetical protein LPLAFNJD_LOCUS1065 [Methylorubrum aminovorans]
MLLPNNDLKSKLSALSSSQALIEFDLGGKVVTANKNFLDAMGYRLEEVQGQHHSLFVDPVERETAAYREFWAELRRGEAQVAEYKRIGKGGREVWIQASYNPLRKRDGKPYGVFKCATDITAQKLRNADFEGKLKALDRSQGIIEFNLDGTVITANPNFLAVVGYGPDEVRGKHHRMFVDSAEQGAEYERFWEVLRQGEFQQAEYKRIAKGGREVWIQATYNPVRDASDRLVKVVKFATDITASVTERLRRAELQRGIDRDLDGIASSISRASQQAMSAASAAEQASGNTQSVAAGAEELAASVGEISQQVTRSLQVTGRAVEQANATSTGRHPGYRGWGLCRRGHPSRGRATARLHAGHGSLHPQPRAGVPARRCHPPRHRARSYPGAPGTLRHRACKERRVKAAQGRAGATSRSPPRVVTMHVRRRRAAVQATGLPRLAEPLQGAALQAGA